MSIDEPRGVFGITTCSTTSSMSMLLRMSVPLSSYRPPVRRHTQSDAMPSRAMMSGGRRPRASVTHATVAG